jgi:hypothetical protein
MADWKDFFEDNKELFGQFLDSLAERRGTKRAPEALPVPPLRFCPLCHAAFIEDSELAIHIRSLHGQQYIYLRVNGRIIRDLGWADRGISELRLVSLGFPRVRVEICGPQVHKFLDVRGDEDLKRLVPADFEGELTLRVTPPGNRESQFTIYSRSLPEFRCEALDALMQTMSLRCFEADHEPDIIEWRERMGETSALENRYLNGFFEYTLAFFLEKTRQFRKAKEHFEEAFGLLLPFRTALSLSAQCVLGLRMNCFGVLAKAPRKSVVSSLDVFFNKPFPSNWTVSGSQADGSPFMSYADEFTIRFVQVVVDFYTGDPSNCRAGIEALDFHPASREKNNEDKLALLKGRFYRGAGLRSAARENYEAIRYHPLFGGEAEEYTNG